MDPNEIVADPNMMAALMAGQPTTGPAMPPEGMDPAVMQGMMDTGMAPTASDMPVMADPMLMGGGGMMNNGMPGAVDALASMMDSAAAQQMISRHEQEKMMLAERLKGEYAAAAQVLMERARMMGESVDMPGGPIAGPGYEDPGAYDMGMGADMGMQQGMM